MSANPPEISGVCIIPININNGRIVLASEHDHLLRRLGQVEMVAKDGIDSSIFTIRSTADEYWVVIKSMATFTLVDQRNHSPSENCAVIVEMKSNQLRGLLIPFGVAYLIEVEDGASLVHFTTHADGTHPDDQFIAKGELSGYLSKI